MRTNDPLLALLIVLNTLAAGAERNVGDVPGDGELDEGTRAVLRSVKRPSRVRPEDWDVLLMRYKIKMARNAEVLFNGKVVDQDLAPLEGVRVTGIVLAYDNTYLEKFAPGTEDQVEREWEVVTDREGRFVVRDLRGFSLRVRRFEKEGYVAPSYDACYPIRAGSLGDSAEEGFFVRSHGGTRHAMIGVLLYAYRDGNMLVVIDSVANTNRSRNLNTLR